MFQECQACIICGSVSSIDDSVHNQLTVADILKELTASIGICHEEG
jgi:hypothetical protein